MRPAVWRSGVSILAAPVAIALLIAALTVANSAGERRTPGHQWRSAGALSAPRAYGSATVLADGSVLVVGGLDGDAVNRTSTRTELYEPLAGASIGLPQAVVGRIHHTATRTGDLVVVTGGVQFTDDAAVEALAETEVFDTRSRTWRTAGALGEARTDAGATALADGRVLVTGGHDGPRMLATTEIFDPATGRWAAAAALPVARTQFTIATLRDGRVLVAGGIEFPGRPSASSLLYDPATDVWSDGPRLAFERVLHADVQLADGSVLFVGGQNAAGGSVEIYEPATNSFAFFGTLVETRMLAQAVALPDGSVLVTGGISPQRDAKEFAPRPTAERYDPVRRAFESFASPSEARAFAKLAVLGGGVYQIGGVSRGERGTRSVEALGWR